MTTAITLPNSAAPSPGDDIPSAPTESGSAGSSDEFLRKDSIRPSALATKTPSSAAASGVAGTVVYDSSYIYVCVATDTWKRVAIATW